MSNLVISAVTVSAVAVTLLSEVRRPRRPDRQTLTTHAHALEVLAAITRDRRPGEHTAAATPDANPARATTAPPGSTPPQSPQSPPFGLAILGPCSDTPEGSTAQRKSDLGAHRGGETGRWRPVPRPVPATPLRITGRATPPRHPQMNAALPTHPGPTTARNVPLVLPAVAAAPDPAGTDNPAGIPVAAAGPSSAATVPLGAPSSRPQRRRRTLTAAVALVVASSAVGAGIAASPVLVGPVVDPGVAPAATQPTTPQPVPDTPAASVPPAAELLRPTGTNGGTVTYTVETPASVDVLARDRAWLGVRTADGQVLEETTLEAGGDTTIPVSNGVEIRLGNPGATTLQVNEVTLELPAADRPLTVVLLPGA